MGVAVKPAPRQSCTPHGDRVIQGVAQILMKNHHRNLVVTHLPIDVGRTLGTVGHRPVTKIPNLPEVAAGVGVQTVWVKAHSRYLGLP